MNLEQELVEAYEKIEELQVENEKLWDQIEQEREQNSSDQLELQSLIADQQKRIAEQKEQIVNLNNSDIELRHSKAMLEESERNFSEIRRREIEAETLTQNAKRDLEKAKAKEKALPNEVNKRVRESATRIREEKEREKREYSVKLGAVSMGLAVYCLIITGLWLIDNGAVLKTTPAWFVNRWRDLQALWGGITSIHEWGSNLLEAHINSFFANAIPFVVILILVVLIGLLILRGVSLAMKRWHELWSNYEDKGKKLFIGSITLALVAISVPLAVIVANLIATINVVSWWLLIASGLNVVYHYITCKRL